MKKFFIFLFAVFLITFMGCQTGFDGSSEIPNSETTEETTGKTTVETNGEETFEVFALDANYDFLTDAKGNRIGIEEINTDFNWPAPSPDPNIQVPKYVRYLYKNIYINGIKFEANNNIYLQGDKNLTYEYKLAKYDGIAKYCLLRSDKYINFIEFYNGISTIDDETISIKFSDLYKEVK